MDIDITWNGKLEYIYCRDCGGLVIGHRTFVKRFEDQQMMLVLFRQTVGIHIDSKKEED